MLEGIHRPIWTRTRVILPVLLALLMLSLSTMWPDEGGTSGSHRSHEGEADDDSRTNSTEGLRSSTNQDEVETEGSPGPTLFEPVFLGCWMVAMVLAIKWIHRE